jgi:hypothetical protein
MKKNELEMEQYASMKINGSAIPIPYDEDEDSDVIFVQNQKIKPLSQKKIITSAYVSLQKEEQRRLDHFLESYYTDEKWEEMYHRRLTDTSKKPIPSRFLNPYHSYKLYMGNVISEENYTLETSMRQLSNWYDIANLNTDPEGKIVTASLAKSRVTSPPWRYFVQRLRSLGNSGCSEWADAVEEFSNDYENLLKNKGILNHFRDTHTISEDFGKGMIDFYDNAAFSFKYTITEEDADISEAVFSSNLVIMLGYGTTEEFCNHVLKNGFINVMKTTKETEDPYKLYLKYYFKIPVKNQQLALAAPMILVNKSGQSVPVLINCLQTIKIMNDGLIEVKVSQQYNQIETSTNESLEEEKMET